ncbi:four helix bundle protein [Trichloromonas acetexigens]|jgi:four helix bundle protein|uniref:Four helix bundle protein n=1 Tax=Trichloromonas acetexigens TaxID=38815 RepID=A0A550J517_9BACT|nr:four helix bundle protein [Desulfuromonas acetexigens]MDK9706372.1 four helix bundle protein [Desulforhopalus sp.]TRO78310.1 four helix bundle protein [Desulfuromonas acetexigens]
MSSFQRFEDIEAWQKARELTKAIYAMSNDGQFARDFGLRDQIRRASVSIMSNIAEGFGRGGNKEFIQFLSTAKGSASEVQAQLYVALDAGYINQDQFQKLYSETEATARMIAGLLRYLQNSDFKGAKYK